MKPHKKWDCPCTPCQKWYRDTLDEARKALKEVAKIEQEQFERANEWRDQAEKQRIRAEAAEALAAAYKLDAERYRWIRGNGAIISRAAHIPVRYAEFGIGLDAAIDSARAEK